jgi:RNA polymerase-binding transcription factor DksA
MHDRDLAQPTEHDLAQPTEHVLASGEDASGTEGYRSMLSMAERVLDDVDRALAALDDGSYATCIRCGAAIADAELDADPTRQQCADHTAPVEGG